MTVSDANREPVMACPRAHEQRPRPCVHLRTICSATGVVALLLAPKDVKKMLEEN
jgi:hypothetical protein